MWTEGAREKGVWRERDMSGTRGETVMTEQEALTCCRDVRASDERQQPYEQQERQHKKRCPPAGGIFILGLLLQGPWCVRLQRPCMRVDGWSRVIFCFASLIQLILKECNHSWGWIACRTDELVELVTLPTRNASQPEHICLRRGGWAEASGDVDGEAGSRVW